MTRIKKRALQRKIALGYKLINEEAVAAHRYELGEVYRDTHGQLALKPRPGRIAFRKEKKT
jgi:hypothetical protein